jgi:hypothetical protein
MAVRASEKDNLAAPAVESHGCRGTFLRDRGCWSKGSLRPGRPVPLPGIIEVFVCVRTIGPILKCVARHAAEKHNPPPRAVVGHRRVVPRGRPTCEKPLLPGAPVPFPKITTWSGWGGSRRKIEKQSRQRRASPKDHAPPRTIKSGGRGPSSRRDRSRRREDELRPVDPVPPPRVSEQREPVGVRCSGIVRVAAKQHGLAPRVVVDHRGLPARAGSRGRYLLLPHGRLHRRVKQHRKLEPLRIHIHREPP